MSKNPEEIKSLIMNEFRKANCKVGQCVPLRTFRFGVLRNLNPKEQELLNQAFDELESEDKIEYRSGSLEAFYLKEAGFEDLYPCLSDEELANIVFSMFKRMNCRVGEGFMMRSIYSQLQQLNPVEKERFDAVFNSLINDGYIYMEGQDFLKLTQKGFDYIY